MTLIPICCRTNLDLEHCDKDGFPRSLPAAPQVGDFIESKHEWTFNSPGTIGHGAKRHLQLKVARITWKYALNWLGYDWVSRDSNRGFWYAEIELSMPGIHPDEQGVCNVIGFYHWYGRLTGKSHHAYIWSTKCL